MCLKGKRDFVWFYTFYILFSIRYLLLICYIVNLQYYYFDESYIIIILIMILKCGWIGKGNICMLLIVVVTDRC